MTVVIYGQSVAEFCFMPELCGQLCSEILLCGEMKHAAAYFFTIPTYEGCF